MTLMRLTLGRGAWAHALTTALEVNHRPDPVFFFQTIADYGGEMGHVRGGRFKRTAGKPTVRGSEHRPEIDADSHDMREKTEKARGEMKEKPRPVVGRGPTRILAYGGPDWMRTRSRNPGPPRAKHFCQEPERQSHWLMWLGEKRL